MSTWAVRAATPGFAVWVRSRVVLCRVHVAPTTEVVATLRSELARIGDPAVVVVVAEPTAGLPDAKTRRDAVALMRRAGAGIEAWLVVLEGSGFVRSAMRTVASTVRLLARPSFKLQIVDSAAAGAAWLAEHTSAVVREDELATPFGPG